MHPTRFVVDIKNRVNLSLRLYLSDLYYEVVQDGCEVVVFSVTYFPVDFFAVLVFMCDDKKTLLFEIGFVYFLDGIVRDFIFGAEDKLVFIGDELFVPDCKEIHGYEHRSGNKKRRRLLIENERVVRPAVLAGVLLYEILIYVAVISEPAGCHDAKNNVDYKVVLPVFANRRLNGHSKVLRLIYFSLFCAMVSVKG